MTAEQLKIEEERKEFIQDVIDRLLYLNGEDLETYKFYLNTLKAIYPIPVVVKDGIRIYRVNKKF